MTDIHGHYDLMKRMLDKIGFSAGDRMILAGDYIDRGPDSYKMLKWIESPGENVILVRGNHDEEFRCYVEVMGIHLRGCCCCCCCCCCCFGFDPRLLC